MYQASDYDTPWATRLARMLDSRAMRLVLITFVLVSVVPELAVGRARWLFFSAFFLGVAAARAAVFRRHTRRRLWDVFLLLADIVVALTFLPWESWVSWITPSQLHALWVARLMVLLRPSQTVLEDLWGILTRRERLQQFTSVTAAVTILALMATALLLNVAPPFDYNGADGVGDDTFLDVLWWSFRQLESADNLVPTLRHDPILVIVSLGLTLVGVFIIAFIIGIGSSVVEQLVRAERRRPVDYDHHSIVVGPVHEAEVLVRQFVSMHEKNRSLRRIGPLEVWAWLRGRGPRPKRHALPRIALLGESDEPPTFLFEPGMRKVLYRSGSAAHPESLALVGAHRAKRVLLLASARGGMEADASTLAALGAVRALTSDAYAYVELFDRANHPLAAAIGGPRTVVLEVPRIVGQFLSAHLVVPGVDQIFQDLLTSSGCEIYTHVLLEPWEVGAARAWASQQAQVSWRALSTAARARGVTLLGVLIGPADRNPVRTSGGVPMDGLTPWMNPLCAPQDPALKALDLTPGQVPVALIAGLVGLSDTYKEIKVFSQHLLRDRAPEPPPAPAAAGAIQAAARLVYDDSSLQRVLILGESAALPALVFELEALVPGVELVVLLPTDDASPPLIDRLEELPLAWEEAEGDPAVGGSLVPLKGASGAVRVVTAPAGRVIQAAVTLWDKAGPFEAVVVLSEEDPHADAITGHRVLRLGLDLLGRDPPPETHILIEAHSVAHGQQIAHDLRALAARAPGLRCTPVSADRIRNYFMVHSAFVPGVDRIYGELLSEWGQDLMLLAWPGGEGTVTWGELTAALAARGRLPIAYQLKGEAPAISPPAEAVVPLYRLRGVYALGDVERIPPARPPLAPTPEDDA